MVRLLIRSVDLSSGAPISRHLTLWLPENGTVGDAKNALAEAKVVIMRTDEMLLLCKSEEMKDTAQINFFSTLQFPNVVHATLLQRPVSGSAARGPEFIARCSPTEQSIVGTQSLTVSVELKAGYVPIADFSGLIECFTERNELVEGRVRQREGGEFAFEATQSLAYDTTYTVLVHGPRLLTPPCEFATWSFGTEKIGDLRLAFSQDGGGNPIVVMDVNRQCSAMLLALQQSVARRFGVGHAWHCIVNLRAVEGTKETLLASNADVAALSDKHLIRFAIDLSCTATDTALARHIVSAREREEYNREYWVNAASGYLAVCGKMSAEEEEQLLLQVVQAFCVPGTAEIDMNMDVDVVDSAPSAPRPSAAVEAQNDAIPEGMLVSSPFTSLTPPLPIFALNRHGGLCRGSDVKSFAHCLRSRGYAVVSLSGDCRAADAVSETIAYASGYFALPLAQKQQHKAPLLTQLGFVDNEPFRKQFFQLRRWKPGLVTGGQELSLNSLLTFPIATSQSEEAAFLVAVDKCYSALHEVAASLAKDLLAAFGFDEAYASSLIEPSDNHESFSSQLGSSNLTVFRYDAPGERGDGDASASAFVSCPAHSDMGLLTVIPLNFPSSSEPASPLQSWQRLHVFDMVEEKWVAIESSSSTPAQTAVVFAGETLTHLTGGTVLPGMHQVSSPPYSEHTRGTHSNRHRTSIPFQLLAARSAQLRPLAAEGASNVSTITTNADTEWASAGHFVDALSSKRSSSNFLAQR